MRTLFVWLARITILVILVVVLRAVVIGLFFNSRRALANTPSATSIPITTSTQVPTKVVNSTSVPTSVASILTPTPQMVFDYTPGGKNYAWPGEGAVQQLEDGWTRIRQAANGQFLPWTFLVRITANQSLEDVAQWDSATKLILANSGDSPITIKVEIRRDQAAAKECNCDPYVQANAKQSPLGLGWFFTGNGAAVAVNNDSQPVNLKGLGVKQISFPKDWTGIWTLVYTIQPNGQVVLNQGERITSVDNWPLPK
jgi:hypothetical protein